MNVPSLLTDEDRCATATELLRLAKRCLARNDPLQAAKLLSQVEQPSQSPRPEDVDSSLADHYETLQISPNADFDTVARA